MAYAKYAKKTKAHLVVKKENPPTQILLLNSVSLYDEK